MNINIDIVNDFIYYKMIEINFVNEKYIKICEIINDDKEKLKDITFNKYFIMNDILYHKNHL